MKSFNLKMFKNLSKLNGMMIINKRTIFETVRRNQNLNKDNLLTIRQIRDSLKHLVGYSVVFGDKEVDKATLSQYKINNQSELSKSPMSQSYAEALIPIGRDPTIRERYVNAYQHVRFGRMLEDLDTMAVHISYLHNKSQFLNLNNQKIAPIVIVTALVDRIEVKKRNMQIDKDLKISGFTSWVGKTSSETTMRLEQEISPNNWTPILEAKFLVCARDIFNKGSAIMNPLELTTSEENAFYELGEKSKILRQKESQESLFNVPPNQYDSLIIHDIFKETIDLKSGSLQHRIKPANSVWMEETKLKNVIICHPEQRNIYNKIFGGFLMRKAFEIGWVNACMYSKSQVEIDVVDDITFRRPVTIGSLLFLSSQVVYTHSNQILVKVHAEVVDKFTHSRDVTNEFYFKFIVPDKAEVPRVIPKTYSEAMIYIDGRRHFS